mmetsp:Transcript_11003/g.44315  ORF Transcript_11003/g.44315 Transcript_11003/m.44315 type:complete len:241 (+) Transcript_11003:1253-1975(+)
MRRQVQPPGVLAPALRPQRGHARGGVPFRDSGGGAQGFWPRREVHRPHGQRRRHQGLLQGGPPGGGKLGEDARRPHDLRGQAQGARGHAREARGVQPGGDGRCHHQARHQGPGDQERPHRPLPLQPHVSHADWPIRRAAGVPPTGDCAGHLRQLPRSPLLQRRQTPFRRRADRPVLPKRDRSARRSPPRARVHAGGDRALRAPRAEGPLALRRGGRCDAVALQPRRAARHGEETLPHDHR